MSNVNAGDLARVVRPFVWEGVGAIVTVVEKYTSQLIYHSGRIWKVNPDAGLLWLCDGWVRQVIENWGEPDKITLLGPQVVISDHCLRKLEDEGVEADKKRELEIPIFSGSTVIKGKISITVPNSYRY